MTDVNPLIARLIELREEEGWSQGHVARMMGVAQSTLSRWESGECSPPWHQLVLYADLLGHTVELTPR